MMGVTAMRMLFAILAMYLLPSAAWAHHVPTGDCRSLETVKIEIAGEGGATPSYVTFHDAVARYLITSYNDAPPPSNHPGDTVLIASHPTMVIRDSAGQAHHYVIIAFFVNDCLTLHDRILTETLQRWLLGVPKV